MRKNLHLAMSLLLALVSVLTACDDDIAKIQDGMTQKVTITASLLAGGEESRALFKDENGKEHDGTGYVDRYLFLLYDGTAAASKLQHVIEIDLKKVVMPYYTELPASTVTRGAVMIANADLSDLGGYAVIGTSTLNDLNYAAKEVTATYNNPDKPDDPYNFTWSDYKEIASADRQITFALNPNMAKVTVTVTNDITPNYKPSEKMELVNVQVRNVPNRVRFAQNALEDGNCKVSLDNKNISYIDYEIEPLSVPNKGDSKTYSWLVPYNAQGTGYVRPNAPANATYIEVDGVRRLDYMDTAYKIYPGTVYTTSGQYTENYDVVSDFQYSMTVTISDTGIHYDASKDNVGDDAARYPQMVNLPTGTNSYMIHPKISRTADGTVYQLPIDRVNEYWGDATITDDTEWNMFVIWQDIPSRSIHFTNAEGTVKTDYYHGKGKNPAYFKFADAYDNISVKVTSEQLKLYGNILVGLTLEDKSAAKKDDAYKFMWSWHLWVTDYNPDAAPKPSDAEAYYNTDRVNSLFAHNSVDYTGDVIVDDQGYYFSGSSAHRPHGNVQHFHHTRPEYWGNNTTSDEYWDGIYKEKWMMDRYLGSKGPINIDLVAPTDAYGMYYQYGRKDPFPYYSTYYITGVARTSNWTKVAGPLGVEESIYHPNNYITKASSTWSSDANTNPWYSPTPVTKDGQKTIYDPCPAGWCLPKYDVFDFMKLTQGNTIYENTYYTTAPILAQNYTIYYNCTKNSNNTGSWKDPQRHMAVVANIKYVAGNWYKLDAVLVLQPEISTLGNQQVFANDQKDVACVWVVDPRPINYGGYIGMSGNGNWLFNGTAGERAGSDQYALKSPGVLYTGNGDNNFAARAHPVRCIQDPYED